ncbi:hypothetical protein J1614_012218 [Plenodomus biglobosus]|nr:hypothetical protein J1614_012218 [Plenodomus biglobosus]
MPRPRGLPPVNVQYGQRPNRPMGKCTFNRQSEMFASQPLDRKYDGHNFARVTDLAQVVPVQNLLSHEHAPYWALKASIIHLKDMSYNHPGCPSTGLSQHVKRGGSIYMAI